MQPVTLNDAPIAQALRSPLPGSRTLLMGPTGVGKTYAIRTLANAGLETFVLFTEPGMETISDDSRIRWRYIPPATSPWSDLIQSAKLINTMSNEALQKLTGISQSGFAQFIDILHQCNDFKVGDRSYGDISRWSTGRALVLDGLTGLSKQSRQLAVGSKPIMTQPDWGVSMDNLEKFIDKLTQDLWCHFVLIAHVEPERDELTGAIKNMPSTLGRKLAPKLPVNFGDVVLAYREGDKFYWSTADARTDLKARLLPVNGKLNPDFVAIIEAWKKKGGLVEPSEMQAPQKATTK